MIQWYSFPTGKTRLAGLLIYERDSENMVEGETGSGGLCDLCISELSAGKTQLTTKYSTRKTRNHKFGFSR